MARVPRAVAAVTIAWTALLLGASLLWPMGYGYDERSHVDMAYVYAHDPFHFYGPGELTATRAGTAIINQQAAVGWPPKQPFGAVGAIDRADRASMSELGGAALSGSNVNQMLQHPPLAYWGYALVLRVPGVDHLAWDVQVWLLRLASILIALPIPALCWATARRLLGDGRWPLVAAAVPLSMPNLVRECASVSNDVLLITASSALLYLLVRVMTGDLALRTAAGVATTLAIAVLAKGFGLILVPLVALAYLIGGLPGRPLKQAVRAITPGMLVAAAGGALGGLWWLRNLLLYGAVQVNGFGPEHMRRAFGVRGDADDGTLSTFAWPFVRNFSERIWGGIGLAGTLSPGRPLVWAWLAVLTVGLLIALTVRTRPWARVQSAAIVGVLAATVAVVASASLAAWEVKAVGPAAAQGRYVYHLVAGFTAVSLVGWSRITPRAVARWLPPATLLAALAMNAVSWLAVLRSWYAPDRSARTGWDVMLAWSPVAEPVTLTLVAVVPALAGLGALAALVRATPAARD